MTWDREQIARDARFISGTPEGERFLGYFLDFTHILSDSMPRDGNDSVWKFNEGQRSVGNEIVALLVNKPEAFRVSELRRIASWAEGETLE